MIDRISFSTMDLDYSQAPDCVIPADDPIYNNLATHNNERITLPNINSGNLGEIQRRYNIKPGTEEWFQLWFKGAR